jgi:hypothetical protein
MENIVSFLLNYEASKLLFYIKIYPDISDLSILSSTINLIRIKILEDAFAQLDTVYYCFLG